MRHSGLDLNLLNALSALLKEKSVTRAGELLHVTQPAMSGILGRLRDYFDDPLIVPVGRKMDLTPLAESLLQPINDLLLRIDATIRLRSEFDPQTTRRHFTLVASDYTISLLLATVMKRVRHDAPGFHRLAYRQVRRWDRGRHAFGLLRDPSRSIGRAKIP